MPASRIYNPQLGGGGGGPTPDPNAEEIQTQEFDFSSGVLPIFNIPANAKISSVSINVQTAFDGAGASIEVGDAGDSARLMPTSRNDLYEGAVYINHPIYEYAVSTPVFATIVQGTSTLGNGYITIVYNINN